MKSLPAAHAVVTKLHPWFYAVLYTANLGSTISAFNIDTATGALTAVGPATVVGGTPMGIAIDPSGRFVYVANTANDNSIYTTVDNPTYSINLATGALTQTGSFSSGGRADFVSVDPLGRFVYAVSHVSGVSLEPRPGVVSVYGLGSSAGALTAIGNPITVRTSPTSLVIDPSGKFAYVTNFNLDIVSIYSIDAATGTLTEIGTAKTGSGPRAFALSRGVQALRFQ
jgi:6-phosphogluconolactonase